MRAHSIIYKYKDYRPLINPETQQPFCQEDDELYNTKTIKKVIATPIFY